jgi:DNA-directed RNA polymerase specialized sigma24 family protein
MLSFVEVSHMQTHATRSIPVNYDEEVWYDLYVWLLPLIEKWVYYANVVSWRGQQKEIAEDIAQEAVMRTFHYSQRANRGEVREIESLKSLGRTIAQNHFRDRRKKDWCLLRPTENEAMSFAHLLINERIDPALLALDHLIFTSMIISAAHTLAKFPPRQRSAILTDLANCSDFDASPTLLEQALHTEGIRLRDYHRPLPDEPAERSKHAVHLCIAYKRLRKAVEV